MGGLFSRRRHSPRLPRKTKVTEFLCDYEFDYDCLVFEDGGAKGFAYIGALKVLDEVAILPKIKRVAGVGTSSLLATFVAVGCNSLTIEEHMNFHLKQKFYIKDECYPYLLPSLINYYGQDQDRKLLDWCAKFLKDKTGYSNITFMQIYEKFGRELCIVLTNLSKTCEEYFHPKTYPDVPVLKVLEISLMIPGSTGPTELSPCTEIPSSNYWVGSLLCNFPVHCFDGWWLSMDRINSFMRKLRSANNVELESILANRFQETNKKVIGFVLGEDKCSIFCPISEEEEILDGSGRALKEVSRLENETRSSYMLDRQYDAGTSIKAPDTLLFRRHTNLLDYHQQERVNMQSTISAFDKFCRMIAHMDENTYRISCYKLAEKLINEKCLSVAEQELIFGKPLGNLSDAVKICRGIADNGKEVGFSDVQRLLKSKVIDFHSRCFGYSRYKITDATSLMGAVTDTLQITAKRAFTKPFDPERTIGIDCGYITKGDYDVEESDLNYLEQQGRASISSFLLDAASRLHDSDQEESSN